ncbi:GTP-binding protein SAR1-like [Liolophura sinensis]|uniref:GTP-binding protein SAR1-like n=1 Tax=Liolophura sinensis TaxID=3198878 RepID=UPI0031585879
MDLLRYGKLKQHQPTFQTRSTAMKFGDVTFTVYDLGGHVQARRVWRDYFPAVDAVVFVIDAAEREAFEESSQELHRILSDEDISEVPVLILGNKIDRADAASYQELIDSFRLCMVLTGKDGKPRESLPSRPAELFMTSLVGKQGYGEAFRWLSRYI